MRDKVAYAAGDFGCNMSFALKGTVQTFWLVYSMMGMAGINLTKEQLLDLNAKLNKIRKKNK